MITVKRTMTYPRNVTAASLGNSQDGDQTKQTAVITTFSAKLTYHRSEWVGQTSQSDWQPLLTSIATLQATRTYIRTTGHILETFLKHFPKMWSV